ncbi:vacuolar transporter chaperone 4 [Pseudomassariella vexata]|uniref:Vacuolar transporter chaperone complex subunit 4 n=1 Tax=Pseudomassariella vexata TaxID=1141098 RepID=A0A1Y2DE44_9PEZI|nr:vacuolar transporter chaperone 4 [Pseudomassariella vexata]ORY57477.1 vacuolar transporter chaperone 4 [Pseudomassariella vexata]
MKFGEQLRSSRIKEYEWYYIDYEDLKNQLKSASGPPIDEPSTNSKKEPKRPKKQWTDDDEARFLGELDKQLEKVFNIERVKNSEVQRVIQTEETEINNIVRRMDARQRREDEQEPTEEEFIQKEEALSMIIAEVHDLSKFVQLNYTGFTKIIKKHDKVTRWQLKPVWVTHMKSKPFYKEDYDAEIAKLSKLYNLVKTRGNPATGDSAAGGSQGSFVRQTTKYWVHPDNVTELKLIIGRHLPILIYNAEKKQDPADAAITSIYYDNPEKWDLYEGRLKKTEGAEAIRLRWYGGMRNEEIFVERKTHREDWTGEQSVKARFNMKEKNVNAYLRGDLLPAAMIEKVRKENKKTEQQLAEQERLAQEVQYSVLKKGYVPVCRSFYNRTAFQLPADARVRISLDTELTMIREDNLDGVKRCGNNWRRMDIGIDHPFSQLPDSDVVRFPYAILEVKLQTQHGQETPEWVRQLISSHLVEAVPKFSKFIHGVASLFPDRINLLPFWMPQMDVDIRKPITYDFGLKRSKERVTTSGSTSDDDDDLDSDDEAEMDVDPHPGPSNGASSTAAAEGLATADLEDQTAEDVAADEDYPIYESDDEDESADAFEEARRVGGMSYYSALAKKYTKTAGQRAWTALQAMSPHPRGSLVPLSNRHQMFFGGQNLQHIKFKAPKGKKIYVPVRVEPKVYFAAERTFLGWLEFSIYIGTIAATLLNFGAKPNMVSFLAATAFTVLAVCSLIYSVGIYVYRCGAIRERRVIKYHDRFGPTVLCAALFVAVALNFAFEGRERHIW